MLKAPEICRTLSTPTLDLLTKLWVMLSDAHHPTPTDLRHEMVLIALDDAIATLETSP